MTSVLNRAHRIAPDRRRLLGGLAVALLVTLTCWSRVYTGFTPYRFKVIETAVPETAGQVTVSTQAFPGVRSLPPAVAVIARVRTDANAPAPLTIAIDGQPICTTTIGGARSHRVDCASLADWSREGDRTIGLARSGTWTLEYLELATHHGNSFGFNTFFVAPAGAAHHEPAGLITSIMFGIVAFLLMQVPPSSPRSRAGRRAIGVFIGLIAILAIGILAAPLVSPYLVVLSTGTFTRWLALALAPRLWTAGRWLAMTEGRAMTVVRATAVATVVALMMSAPVRWWLNGSYHDNYSGFLSIPASHFDANPLLNTRDDIRRSLILLDHGGYDGQFMYFATFDPFLRAFKDQPEIYGRIFDQAPYRYGRMAFPVLTRLLSFGQWQRFPATIVWSVVAGLFALAAMLAWAAERRGLSAAVGALVAFVPGFWLSVQAGLPEPLAGATLVGALLCLASDRVRWAACLFAVSLLFRETGIIAVVASVLGLVFVKRRSEALFLALVAFTPLVLWRIYSGVILYPDWGSRAFLSGAPPGRPLSGILAMWSLIANGAYWPGSPSFAIAGITFPLLLLAALGLSVLMMLTSPNVPAFAGLVYTAGALTLSYEGVWLHVGNAERTTYEVFLMLLLSVLNIRRYPPWLRTALVIFWVAAGAYVTFGGYDSAHIRETLWPERLS